MPVNLPFFANIAWLEGKENTNLAIIVPACELPYDDFYI